MVYVTNRSDKEHEDGFAGVRYTFPPGESVQVPEEAARHIFGYGEEDKEPHLARLGWIRLKTELPEGLKRLEQFQITVDLPKEHHSLSPVVAQVPLPARRGGGKPVQASA
jgi:hypothetical protein